MPYDEVMPKFKKGELHSGSKEGPTVTKRKQAVAIMLSEQREADKGKKEYKPKKYQLGGAVEHSDDGDETKPMPVTNNSERTAAYNKGGPMKKVKKFDDGGPVSSAKADELPPPAKITGRISAGKDPDVQTDSDNKITGRIKASAYNKGGAVTSWRRW
jgi:Family of unknown function (DUF6496)